MKLIDNIFSVKNNSTHKILTILGLKFRFKKSASAEEVRLLRERLERLSCQTKNLFYELNDPRTLQNIKLPIVKNKFETLDKLVNSEVSMCRFGDGEFKIMINKGSTIFQQKNEALSKRLADVFKSNDENILICVNDTFGCINYLLDDRIEYWHKFLYDYRDIMYSYIDFDKTYYDARVTRPYCSDKDKSFVKAYFQKFKLIWDNKNIVIVEGDKTRFGVGNDLINNAKSVKRIICPSQNAFEKYEEILKECLKMPKDTLFILALGPAATILAYDLTKILGGGGRALDIGHLDIEYEWFIRGCEDRTAINCKSVSEVSVDNLVEECYDKDYREQIICRI